MGCTSCTPISIFFCLPTIYFWPICHVCWLAITLASLYWCCLFVFRICCHTFHVCASWHIMWRFAPSLAFLRLASNIKALLQTKGVEVTPNLETRLVRMFKWGTHVWICILLSTPQKLQASAVMLLWRGNPCQPEGERKAEVLPQSVHHLLSEGGRGLFIPHCLCITQHTNTDHWGVPAQSAELMQHPPPRFFLKAERTVARPELWLHTPASCLAAHAQWAPRGAQCVCRVASVWPELFLIRPRLASVMASLWHGVVNLTLDLPNLCFLCIPVNCNIQPTACKKTWVSELKLPSLPHLQKSENSSRNRVLYRNLRCLWASKPNLNRTSIFRSLQVHFQTVMRFIAVNIGR